ncbi:MAG: HAD family hydrolase [Leptolinea sp.]|jgi:soluble P-type ATPase|nr:HAD family hydrolase [Leptolinea sp.]
MIDLTIPGMGNVQILHLVLDVNGTLAVDGTLLEGMPRALASLAGRLQIHLITADTHGHKDEIDRILGIESIRLQPGGETAQKARFVRELGGRQCAAIGQGANDALMLSEAILGIAVLSPEGLCVDALKSARIVMPDIFSAFGLLENPQRIVATLRT